MCITFLMFLKSFYHHKQANKSFSSSLYKIFFCLLQEATDFFPLECKPCIRIYMHFSCCKRMCHNGIFFEWNIFFIIKNISTGWDAPSLFNIPSWVHRLFFHHVKIFSSVIFFAVMKWCIIATPSGIHIQTRFVFLFIERKWKERSHCWNNFEHCS